MCWHFDVFIYIYTYTLMLHIMMCFFSPKVAKIQWHGIDSWDSIGFCATSCDKMNPKINTNAKFMHQRNPETSGFFKMHWGLSIWSNWESKGVQRASFIQLIQKTPQDKPSQTRHPGKNRQKEATTEKIGAVKAEG